MLGEGKRAPNPMVPWLPKVGYSTIEAGGQSSTKIAWTFRTPPLIQYCRDWLSTQSRSKHPPSERGWKESQLQRTANHPGQRIEGLAKIGLPGRSIDLSVGDKAQHLGKISRMDRKVEGSKPGGSRRAQPDGATLSGPSVELAEADGVQSTGTKAGVFWEAMEWVGCSGCGDWVG